MIEMMNMTGTGTTIKTMNRSTNADEDGVRWVNPIGSSLSRDIVDEKETETYNVREIENAGMHECKIMTLSTSMTAKKKGNKRPLVMSDEVDGVDGVAFMIEIMTLSATVIVGKKVKGNERTPVMSDEDDIDEVAFVIKEDGSNHHTQVK